MNKFILYFLNDHYTHKIRKTMSLKKDNYEIMLVHNFIIIVVDIIVVDTYYLIIINKMKFISELNILIIIIKYLFRI